MARVKRGVTSRAKHNKVFKQAKGFYGRRKNTIRAAKAAVDRKMPMKEAQQCITAGALASVAMPFFYQQVQVTSGAGGKPADH